MRLEKVAAPITPAAFTTDCCSPCPVDGGLFGAVGSDMGRILAEYSQGVYEMNSTNQFHIPAKQDPFKLRSFSVGYSHLGLLNQFVGQLIGVVAGTAGTDLREDQPAGLNGMGQSVGDVAVM